MSRKNKNDGNRTSDTTDLETSTNLGGQLALGPAQDNIQEFLVCGHRRNLPSGENESMVGLNEIRQEKKLSREITHIFPRSLHDGHCHESNEY